MMHQQLQLPTVILLKTVMMHNLEQITKVLLHKVTTIQILPMNLVLRLVSTAPLTKKR